MFFSRAAAWPKPQRIQLQRAASEDIWSFNFLTVLRLGTAAHQNSA